METKCCYSKEYSWKAEFADCYLLFCFFFYSHVPHLLGNKKKKMFDILGPKVVFLPAKINGYRRREKERVGGGENLPADPSVPRQVFLRFDGAQHTRVFSWRQS